MVMMNSNALPLGLLACHDQVVVWFLRKVSEGKKETKRERKAYKNHHERKQQVKENAALTLFDRHSRKSNGLKEEIEEVRSHG